MSDKNMLRVRFFALLWILAVLVCTVIVLKIIYGLWFPPFLEKSKTAERRLPLKVIQMSELVRGIAPDNYSIGYKSLESETAASRFHDWEIRVPADKVNVCINCHGNIPHNKDKRTRGFLNKHDAYMSCETCHTERRERFAWYDTENGTIQSTLQLNSPLRFSRYKLASVADGAKSFADASQIAESDALLRDAHTLSPADKRERLKIFHGKKLEKPLVCKSCHTSQAAESVIPFASLGYTELRARQVAESGVVGMLENYDMFYLPNFLTGESIQ